MSVAMSERTFTTDALDLLANIKHELHATLCDIAESAAVSRTKQHSIDDVDIETAARTLVDAVQSSNADEAVKLRLRGIVDQAKTRLR